MDWNLRVSAALHQGDRKYMEDQYAIHYECDKESGKFLYVYFGVFDGHGGADAAKYTKAHLHKNITANILFFSDDPNDVLRSIEAGFLKTHEDMWQEIGKWPPTATGLPSTAGTTASVVFIKDCRLYIGHVGDSGIALGMQEEKGIGRGKWVSEYLTVDHKPDSPAEKSRIERMGGKVVPKAGVPRVVWQRPREKGPIRREDQVDHIPFLAVGRSLGDLWSYNVDNQQYAISPKPDVEVRTFNPLDHKCLILASDGLWNLLDHKGAATTVEMTDRKWFREAIYEKGFPKSGDPYYHHASTLVNIALRRWRARRLRADNTSAIVIMIDPPGLPVHEAVDKMAALANQTRNRGQKFCARTYLKENEETLQPSEKYVLGMTGSYNLQYYEDKDRFELHFGKPSVRHDVPKGVSADNASNSIAMYDVIIHKVMTPSKSVDNLASLNASSNNSFSKLRKSQSSKDLKRFRPKAGALTFGSWLDVDCEDSSPDEEKEADSPSPPGFIDGDEGVASKTADELNTEDQTECSPEVSSQQATEETARRQSPDSTSNHPLPRAATNNPTKKTSILRRLKGVAKSLSSLHDHKKPGKKASVKPDSTSWKSVKLRRTGRKPLVVAGSPAKKRHSSSIDTFGGKRMRMSPPCVQLTKVSTVADTESRICLRPRLK